MPNRDQLIEALAGQPEKEWDVVIIGGGSTGLGVALDSLSRGLDTLLLERADFSKGTSSRSTKLVHGGVRYLAQGQIDLVREALRERGLLQKNAPHLVQNKTFVIPSYTLFNKWFYTVGLKIYDMLAGSLTLGKSRGISKKETLKRISTIREKGLRGGVTYQDGQFDDARLSVNLVQTCLEKGGILLNYATVTGLYKENETVAGVRFTDCETGNEHLVKGKAVVNATGVFADDILKMDEPSRPKSIRPSQGVHLVFEKEFLPGDDAIMIPKTDDGRVLFAVPWHNKVVVGTTDTLVDEYSLEPVALEHEIEFILETAGRYLQKKPTRNDVKSVFVGLRPLAAPTNDSGKTKEISRSHKVFVTDSGLITITGGKWTTFRKMGEDTVDKAVALKGLSQSPSRSEEIRIHGADDHVDFNDPLYFYGTDKEAILSLANEQPDLAGKLHPDYPHIKAQVVWAAREEMARSVEDFLARRIRILFLDAQAAMDMAPETARLMQHELGKEEGWAKQQISDFTALATRYLLEP
ncbi:MAG: glycerol-3-phosphate dehydrogenase/oxidase [Balneolaceae bacterium]